MHVRLDEVAIYNDYSEEPEAENSFQYADSAVAVYVHKGDEATTLTTVPEPGDSLFGHLHTFEDPDYEEDRRYIVVKKG